MKVFSASLLLAAPAATLAAAPPNYTRSDLGAEACPAGSAPLTNEQWCGCAAEAIGYDYQHGDSWNNRPTGCFCNHQMLESQCYYNTNQYGGESDTSFIVCAEPRAPLDLALISSPYSGSTACAGDYYRPSCGGNGNEAMFQIWLEPGQSIEIGQTENDFDSRHELSWGGDTPGQNVVACTDDPDTSRHQWANTQSSGQNVFFVIDAYSTGSGSFTLSWNVYFPTNTPTSSPTSTHSPTSSCVTEITSFLTQGLSINEPNGGYTYVVGTTISQIDGEGTWPNPNLLGDFESYDEESNTAAFEGGTPCGHYGERNAIVHFEEDCSVEPSLTSVTEPSICYYVFEATGLCCAPVVTGTISPTTSPTETPTESPTGTPTASPTASPTAAGPWKMENVGSKANFSNNGEVVLEYHVGLGRDFRIDLYRKGCAARVNTTLFDTTNVTKPYNASYQALVVTHTFAISELAQSDIWNGSSNMLQVCQKLYLFVGDMDIIEDIREIEIAFDMAADFNTSMVLAAQTIENATEDVDFQGDVGAYKCVGGNGDGKPPFDSDTARLAPNQALTVCITSDNGSVKLAELTNMIIEQENATPVKVVDGGNVVVEAITEVDYDESPGNIMLTNRVPIDRFSFETGKNITVSGQVELELANGRRLRALTGEDSAAAEEPQEAGYTVTVNLKSEADGVEEDQAPIGSSGGHAINGMGFGALFSVVLAVMSLVM